ncbi:MAG: hypothetical protein NNA23_13710, partial [Nitrospira sp.]|nr:hypothetical protein [Nitrospira sp.]
QRKSCFNHNGGHNWQGQQSMGTCAVNGVNRHAVDWMSAPGEPPTTSHKALWEYRRAPGGAAGHARSQRS